MASIKRVDIEKDLNAWIQTFKKETEPPPLPQYYAFDAPEPAPVRGSTVKTAPATAGGETRKVNFNETPMTTSFSASSGAVSPSSNVTSPSTTLVGNRPGGAPPPVRQIPGGVGASSTTSTFGAGSSAKSDDLILKLDEGVREDGFDDDAPPPSLAAPTPVPEATPPPASTPAPSTPALAPEKKLPPGARPLFGPAIPTAKKEPAAGGGAGSAALGAQRGAGTPPPVTGAPPGRGRAGAPPPATGGFVAATPGRGRAAPPPVTGGPPKTAVGRGITPPVEAQRKQSNGSFFKDLVASVDDLGSDPDTLDAGLGALSATTFDDIDIGDPPASPPPAAAPPAGAPAANFIGWAKAQFDYDATDDDELTFKENDMIHLLGKDDSGWWSGEFNGKIGLFPANYVEEI